MSLTAVLVDDEALARQVLREFLALHPEIDIVAECANGFEAVKAVTELHPTLLFLDIQMPKLDGFEVLELVGDAPAVIFVTAFDTHALRAFEVHAVDYLLKPFNQARLDAALARALERVAGPARPAPSPSALSAAARPPAHPLERLVVRDGARVAIIPVAQLDYARAQDDYVELVAGGKSHLKQQTIASLEASLEAALEPTRFVRIHRSYLVNLDRVARLEPLGGDSHVAVLRSGVRLPVSRSGHARLRAALAGG